METQFHTCASRRKLLSANRCYSLNYPLQITFWFVVLRWRNTREMGGNWCDMMSNFRFESAVSNTHANPSNPSSPRPKLCRQERRRTMNHVLFNQVLFACLIENFARITHYTNAPRSCPRSWVWSPSSSCRLWNGSRVRKKRNFFTHMYSSNYIAVVHRPNQMENWGNECTRMLYVSPLGFLAESIFLEDYSSKDCGWRPEEEPEEGTHLLLLRLRLSSCVSG